MPLAHPILDPGYSILDPAARGCQAPPVNARFSERFPKNDDLDASSIEHRASRTPSFQVEG